MDALKIENLDNPAVTLQRRNLIKSKKFLRNIYREWYQRIQSALPPGGGRFFELGSGAGIVDQFIPGVISSDIMPLPFVDVVMDGKKLPLRNAVLDGLILVNVFHHISNVRAFLKESIRVLKTNGRIVMIEPWVNSWSHFIYSNFHHEQLGVSSVSWNFPTAGPLSSSNQALPWIIFKRDYDLFAEEFSQLRLCSIEPLMPITYLLSGGFSTRFSMPAFTYAFWRLVEEKLLNNSRNGMFALIVLERIK